jgi:hypothetical protein
MPRYNDSQSSEDLSRANSRNFVYTDMPQTISSVQRAIKSSRAISLSVYNEFPYGNSIPFRTDIAERSRRLTQRL